MKLLKDPRLRAYLGLAVLAAGLVGLALSGDLLVHSLRFASFYVLSGAGFALLATAATSLPLRAAIVAAVILRLLFLPVMPSLTTDYYRYVWDGRVQLAGINPYKYRPYEHQLDRVRFAGRALINHDELKTAYPPLTEAVFLGVAVVTHAAGLEHAVTPRAEVILFKLVFGAFDLATAAAVWFLAARKFRPRATVLYLLCPSGHPADVGVRARGGCGGVLLRARRRPARAPPRRLGRRRSGPRRGAQGHAARRCSCRRCWAGGRRPPASSPASSRRSSSPTSRTSSPAAPSARCSRAARAGRAARSSSRCSRCSRLPRRPLARAGPLHRRRPVDRRQLPRPREHRGGLRLDVHAAHPVSAGGPRLVLAHAAGAGPGRRPLAPARARRCSHRFPSRCRWPNG